LEEMGFHDQVDMVLSVIGFSVLDLDGVNVAYSFQPLDSIVAFPSRPLRTPRPRRSCLMGHDGQNAKNLSGIARPRVQLRK
jgi:hypothetical protein